MHASPLSVLHVDDEAFFLDVCRIHLGRHGIDATTAVSARAALDILEERTFDVIVTDYQMPEIDGIEFLKILKGRKCTIPVILFTGMGRGEVMAGAMSHGAADFHQKGGNPKTMIAELVHKIREASRKSRAEEAAKESQLHYAALAGCSGHAVPSHAPAECAVAGNAPTVPGSDPAGQPKKAFTPWMIQKQEKPDLLANNRFSSSR